jgi:hypothetical protein
MLRGHPIAAYEEDVRPVGPFTTDYVVDVSLDSPWQIVTRRQAPGIRPQNEDNPLICSEDREGDTSDLSRADVFSLGAKFRDECVDARIADSSEGSPRDCDNAYDEYRVEHKSSQSMHPHRQRY